MWESVVLYEEGLLSQGKYLLSKVGICLPSMSLSSHCEGRRQSGTFSLAGVPVFRRRHTSLQGAMIAERWGYIKGGVAKSRGRPEAPQLGAHR